MLASPSIGATGICNALALAAHLEIGDVETLDHLYRSLIGRHVRPHSLTDVVTRALCDGDWEHHLRDCLDAFYGADGDTVRQTTFIAEEPGLLRCPKADAFPKTDAFPKADPFLGGVGEHLARRWGRPIPTWVRAGEGYLTSTLFVPDERALRGYLVCVSPVAFRTRLIFTGPDPLQRARFPYRRGVITMPLEHPPGAPR